MKGRRCFIAFFSTLPALSLASRGDPLIGVALELRAAQFTRITGLWFDELQMIGVHGSGLYVRPSGTKHMSLSLAGLSAAPLLVSAEWRYQAPDAVDEAAQSPVPEEMTAWREARANVPLRSQMAPDLIESLRRQPRRHRLQLGLLFDRDRLLLRWDVQQLK